MGKLTKELEEAFILAQNSDEEALRRLIKGLDVDEIIVFKAGDEKEATIADSGVTAAVQKKIGLNIKE